jgi:hypothetical protein
MWLTQPITEMNTRKGEGGKGGRCVGLTSSPPSCSDCLKIWETHPPETLRPCIGFALPFALEIMSNGQILCGLKVKLAMSSTCTYNYYPCPWEKLTPEHCTKYFDLAAVSKLNEKELLCVCRKSFHTERSKVTGTRENKCASWLATAPSEGIISPLMYSELRFVLLA